MAEPRAHLLDEVEELGAELDAGGAAADDDGVQQTTRLRLVDARLQRQLEVAQDTVANLARVPHFLQQKRQPWRDNNASEKSVQRHATSLRIGDINTFHVLATIPNASTESAVENVQLSVGTR